MESNPEQPIIQYLVFALVITIIVYVLSYIYYIKTGCYESVSYMTFMSSGMDRMACTPSTLLPPRLLPPVGRKEVFHISDQIYTYEEAQCKCAAYGGRLATESEIVDAYNRGANWCTYGWSQGQHAFFPVNELTATCRHKKGVHGGYFPNPNIRFGINCYGVKPAGAVKVKPITPGSREVPVCKRPGVGSRDLGDSIVGFNDQRWSIY